MEDYGDIPRLYNPTLRLVDLNLLAKILWCQQCCLPLSLRKAVLDKYNMYKSELHIKCLGCSEVKVVPLTLLGPDGNCGAYQKVLRIRYAKQDLKVMTDKCLEANKQPSLIKQSHQEEIKIEPLDEIAEDVSSEAIQETSASPEPPEAKEFEKTDEEESSSDSAPEPDCSEYEPSDGDLDSSCMSSNEVLMSGEEEENSEKQPRKAPKCLFCQEEFTSWVTAASHMTENHPDYLKLKCRQCKKKFPTKRGFTLHMQRHNNSTDAARICPHCGKMCNNSKALDYHMKSHISEKDASTPCPVCHKLFKSKDHLYRHKLTHDPPFVCDFCSKKFSKRSRLEEHVYLHVSNKTFDCEICGAKFLQKDNRNTHMKNNHNWICLVCGGKFGLMETVRDHCEKEHSKEQIEASQINGVSYEKVTRFQCKYCCRFLASKQSLEFHLNTHTGEGKKRSQGSTKKRKVKGGPNEVDATSTNKRGRKRSRMKKESDSDYSQS